MEDSVCHHKNLDMASKQTKSNSARKKHPKVVKGSKLSYLSLWVGEQEDY